MFELPSSTLLLNCEIWHDLGPFWLSLSRKLLNTEEICQHVTTSLNTIIARIKLHQFGCKK